MSNCREEHLEAISWIDAYRDQAIFYRLQAELYVKSISFEVWLGYEKAKAYSLLANEIAKACDSSSSGELLKMLDIPEPDIPALEFPAINIPKLDLDVDLPAPPEPPPTPWK